MLFVNQLSFIDKLNFLKYIHGVVICPKFTGKNVRNMPKIGPKVFVPSLVSESLRSVYFRDLSKRIIV